MAAITLGRSTVLRLCNSMRNFFPHRLVRELLLVLYSFGGYLPVANRLAVQTL